MSSDPAGIRVDALADLLVGRAAAEQPPPPPPRPPAPTQTNASTFRPSGQGRFLGVVQAAKQTQTDQRVQLLSFLQRQRAPGVHQEQNETDAVACCLSLATRDLYHISDTFGSSVLLLACRWGMQQLSQVILTKGASSEDPASF